MKLTSEECAYLAGLIDGEGCFSIVKRKSRGRVVHQAALVIAMTAGDLLEYWQQRTGLGKITTQEACNGHKKYYRWTLWSRQGATLCAAVRPYLMLKRPCADVFERFRATKGLQLGRAGVSVGLLAVREGLKQEMHALNYRGSTI